MNNMLYYTHHATSRQARRNLSDDDVQFVLAFGQHHYCAGALHIFLGRRDIPSDKATYQRFAHLEGTTLVINATEDAPVLITTYRNRRGLKRIRTKTKYDRRAG